MIGDGLRIMIGLKPFGEIEEELGKLGSDYTRLMRAFVNVYEGTSDMSKLISTRDLTGNAGLRAELQRIVFDANVYIMLGYDDQYIHGKRCYDKAMAILKELKNETQDKPEQLAMEI